MPFAGYGQTNDKKAGEYYHIGNDKVSRKDYTGAIAGFSEAIKRDPGFIQAYENRGVAKFYLKDFTGAIADFTKALEINPDDYSTYSRRGWAKYNLQDYEGAVADFTKAIESKGLGASDYYISRGRAKYRLRDYDGAIADFSKAISIPFSKRYRGEAYYWQGLAKINSGQKESGCSDLSKAGESGYGKASAAMKEYCQ